MLPESTLTAFNPDFTVVDSAENGRDRQVNEAVEQDERVIGAASHRSRRMRTVGGPMEATARRARHVSAVTRALR